MKWKQKCKTIIQTILLLVVVIFLLLVGEIATSMGHPLNGGFQVARVILLFVAVSYFKRIQEESLAQLDSAVIKKKMIIGTSVMLVIFFSVGVFAVCWGQKNYWLYMRTDEEPLKFSLQELESGETPRSKCIEIGEYIRVPLDTAYVYKQEDGDLPSYLYLMDLNNRKLLYALYPIISLEAYESLSLEIEALCKKYGEENIFDDWSPEIKFSVLVKSRGYHTWSELPYDLLEEGKSITGILIGSAARVLDAEHKELVQKAYPYIDLDKVLVLDESLLFGSGFDIRMITFGLGLIFIGFVLATINLRKIRRL